MTDKLQKTNHDVKTPGLNNPEKYVLTQNKFNTYMVSIFTDLYKTQICNIPYRDNQHHVIEIVMILKYLNLFQPNEHT